MRAVQFAEYGDTSVLRIVDVDEPVPAAGEILIEVHAAGVNGIDGKTRAGYLKDFAPLELPAGTGIDAAGVVAAIGAGVADVNVGDAVFGNGRNTVAERAILTSWALKPTSVSFAEAAGYPLPAETAQRMLNLANVSEGDTVFVSGGSGGVGSAAIQFARARGAGVVASASPANHDYLRSLGAQPVSYEDGWVERATRIADGRFDAALDIAGAGVLEALVGLTGDPSRVVTIADFNGAALGVHTTVAADDFPGALALAAELSEAGRFSIPVARAFDLAHTGDAQTFNLGGHAAGRTVVVVR